ncbi:hypothetical protein [Nocardiopsis salina]|uniref:hypothetical protein n=1 Tax=Nocardiopsis salina TaxID=245836 RepID=UPI00034A3606|nr:hypothetical protein [Nocardiopsis salina]
MSEHTTTAARPTTALLQDVFAVLDAHGYKRAPGRVLCAALPHLDDLLAGLTATYEGQEVPRA